MNQTYVDTVRLLLAVAPHVFASGRMGLKGGTALNLFIHDMPRLSVDIDVVFLDYAMPRDEAIAAIGEELTRVKAVLETMKLTVAMQANQEGEEVKLVVSDAGSQVKVEVNQVFRGTVLPTESRELVATAQDLFATTVTLPVLAAAEIYGSKLVAAFDRQHPRDWFDVLHLHQREGLTPEVVDCFVAYLAGHNRPVHEGAVSKHQADAGHLRSRVYWHDTRANSARGAGENADGHACRIANTAVSQPARVPAVDGSCGAAFGIDAVQASARPARSPLEATEPGKAQGQQQAQARRPAQPAPGQAVQCPGLGCCASDDRASGSLSVGCLHDEAGAPFTL